VLDTHYTVQRVNSYMEKLYSERRPLVGQKCWKVYHQRDSVCPYCPVSLTLADGEAHQNIVPYPEDINPTRWLELSVYPMKDGNGKITGIIESVRDVTHKLKADKELREREQELSLISESSVDAIFTVSMDGSIRFISKAIHELQGYNPHELIGHKFNEFVPEDQAEIFWQVMLEAIEQRRVHSFETRVRHKNGMEIPVEITGRVVERRGEKIAQGTIRDITERKLAERSLMESEEKFRMLAENIPGVVFMFETYGTDKVYTLFLGSGLIELVGGELAERIGVDIQRFLALVPADERAALMQQVAICEREQTILDREFRIVLPEDDVRWMRCIGRAKMLEEGLYRWQGVFTDITAKKLADVELLQHRQKLEELVAERTAELAQANQRLQQDINAREIAKKALEESEERFRFLVEKADIGILIGDTSGHIQYWNQRFLDIFDYEEDEFTDISLRDFIHEDDIFMVLHNHMRLARGRVNHARLEFRGLRKDGTVVYLEVDALPIRENGEITGIRSYIWDITNRKRAEEALQQAKEAAETANRAKSEFIFNVSHEIRTPLNCIIGFTELIQQGEDLDVIHDYSRTILNESDLLLMLINDLLDHAKLEAGKMILDFSPFSLQAVVHGVVSALYMKAQEKNLQFEVGIADDVPACLFGDALRLRQILMNLVANAIKFTSEGSVGVFVELSEESSEDSCRLRFSVLDTGIGISPDKQALIFQRFTQADGSTTRKYGGTGLGTTIARQFVELMHGQIGLNSELGRGSEFWCDIPFAICKDELLVKQPTQDTTEDDAQQADKADVCILVAEDYPPNQEVVRLHLTRAGYEVTVAGNGQEAVNLCRLRVFDLILMDIQMPVLDGYAATKAIREQNSLNRDTIIIGLTAHADPLTRRHCLEATMSDTVTKPIRRDSFLRTVNQWLASNRTQNDDDFFAAEPERAAGGIVQPIDYADALNEFGGDAEVLDEILQQFLDNATQQIIDMKAALTVEDFDMLRKEAHKIKGGAANLTAMPLSASAAELEESMKKGEAENAERMVEAIAVEFDRLRSFLAALME